MKGRLREISSGIEAGVNIDKGTWLKLILSRLGYVPSKFF